MDSMKVKMKRHESFSIREGWLVKGINAIKKDPKVFASNAATDILGIGSNMVKSLKYWLIAANIIDDSSKILKLTDFGNLIDKYDPYLDDIFSWWLIHINMALNIEEFYILNIFCNKCATQNFSKENVVNLLTLHLNNKKINFNTKILQDEVNMIIKTYTIDEKIDNPENNFVCPLSELELLRKNGRDVYERNKPAIKKLNYLIVFYLIELIMTDRDSISIDDLIKIENGPSKILNLDKNLLNEYLDELKRNELININRTAGLNMIYIRRKMSLKEIFEEYFLGGE